MQGTTISRYKFGYTFLRKYTETDMKYQIRLLEDILKLTGYGRLCVITYHNQLRKEPYFNQFPTIPKKIGLYR